MKGCRNCTNWQPLGEHLDRDDPATAGRKVELGVCRRFAPRPVSLAESGEESRRREIHGRWPRVASDDWCGEWDPRID